MKYPSCYVLVTDIDTDRSATSSVTSSSANVTSHRQDVTSSGSLLAPYDGVGLHGDGHKPLPTSVFAEGSVDPGGGERLDPMYQCLVEKVWQDQCLVPGQKRAAVLSQCTSGGAAGAGGANQQQQQQQQPTQQQQQQQAQQQTAHSSVADTGDEQASVGAWDFGEPVHKAHCGCSK